MTETISTQGKPPITVIREQRRLANIQRGNAIVSANEMASVIQHVLSQENASDAVTAARARLER